MSTDCVEFENVDIVFGNKPGSALAMVDQGKTRDEISARPGSCWASPMRR
jgi:glycine betaine/proline transport system ATP-binding protein